MKRPARQLLRLGVILAALTLWQWYQHGEVDWHQRILAPLIDREENSGLQVATRQVQALGDKREGAPAHFDLSGRVVRVADGEWIARGIDAPAGTRVRIIGSEGAILLVEPAAPLIEG